MEKKLSGAIRRNMQLKDTDELLRIWKQNNREEWSDEAFSVVQEILLERNVEIPDQNTRAVTKRKRHKKKEHSTLKLDQVPVALWFILSPGIILLFFIFLMWGVSIVISDLSSGSWPIVVILGLLALQLLLVGFYSGWKSWFNGEKTKREILRKIPESKRYGAFYYRALTFFLPERYIPRGNLLIMRIMSVVFLIYGIHTILFLLEWL